MLAWLRLQVCLYAFDCLHLNGETLLQQPLSARREKLYSALIESPGELWFAEAKVRSLTCKSCVSHMPCMLYRVQLVFQRPAAMQFTVSGPSRRRSGFLHDMVSARRGQVAVSVIVKHCHDVTTVTCSQCENT